MITALLFSPAAVQLSLICHPTITAIFLLAAAKNVLTKITNKADTEKVFEFPEFDYSETPKNVKSIIASNFHLQFLFVYVYL